VAGAQSEHGLFYVSQRRARDWHRRSFSPPVSDLGRPWLFETLDLLRPFRDRIADPHLTQAAVIWSR
jgi:hypothetical protein